MNYSLLNNVTYIICGMCRPSSPLLGKKNPNDSKKLKLKMQMTEVHNSGGGGGPFSFGLKKWAWRLLPLAKKIR